jgi:hypothetical protein
VALYFRPTCVPWQTATDEERLFAYALRVLTTSFRSTVDNVSLLDSTFDGRITSWSLRWTETLSLFSTHNPALCSDSAQFLFAQIHRLGVADAPPVGIADAPRHTTAFVLSIDISTFSVRPARILQTLFVSAFLTLNQGISDETGRTRTVRFSLDHPALSVNPASFILETRIPASPIRTATFISFAIRVKSAFVWFALDLRISLVAVRTQTDLSAICRLTNRVFAAIVRIFAHVLTFLVSANFRRRTVVVRTASWEAGASGADLATRARLLRGAFVSAFARSAGLTARTIFRGATRFRTKSDLVAFARTVTFGRHFSASHQRVSQEVCRTTALSNVIFNFAACTDATSGVVIARVLTFVVDARLGVRTRRVASAPDFTQSILTNLIDAAEIVRITNGSANTSHAFFV